MVVVVVLVVEVVSRTSRTCVEAKSSVTGVFNLMVQGKGSVPLFSVENIGTAPALPAEECSCWGSAPQTPQPQPGVQFGRPTDAETGVSDYVRVRGPQARSGIHSDTI